MNKKFYACCIVIFILIQILFAALVVYAAETGFNDITLGNFKIHSVIPKTDTEVPKVVAKPLSKVSNPSGAGRIEEDKEAAQPLLKNKISTDKVSTNKSGKKIYSKKTLPFKSDKISYHQKKINKTNSINSLTKKTSSIILKEAKNNKANNTSFDKKNFTLSDYPQKYNFSNKIEQKKDIKEPNFLNLISSLFFVIILILIVGVIYTKLRGINPTAILAGKFNEKNINKFNLLSTTTLGQGKNIHLVEINGKQLVIGSTVNNINLLTEIQPEDIDKDIKKEDFCEKNSFVDEDIFNYLDPENYMAGHPEIYKEYLEDDK
ncbi:MAG: flagellar biosynthetic protein FliO [bacterium]